MGMYGSLYTSKSGMMAFSQGTNVIGNNLANTNTVGFKSNTVLFSDVMSSAASGSTINASGKSAGVQVAKIGQNMRQGQITTTTNSTDMAISGKGMFALKDPVSGNSYYSRAGSFLMDQSFKLVNSQGMAVQGWQKDVTGAKIGTVPVGIDLTKSPAVVFEKAVLKVHPDRIVVPATASSIVTASSTLAASAQRPLTPTFNANDPTSYNFKTDVVLYDANGVKHTAGLFFVKQGQRVTGQGGNVTNNAVWDWHMAVKGDQIAGGSPNDANTMVEVGGTSLLAAASLPAGTLPAETTIAPSTTLSAAVTTAFTLIDQNGNSATIPATGASSWQANTSLASVAASNGLANTGFYRIGSGGMVAPAAIVGGSNPLIQLAAPVSTVTNGIVDTPAVKVTAQRLEFGGTGMLVKSYAPKVTIPWGSAAAGSITVNMGSTTRVDLQGKTQVGGNDGVTQLGSAFAANVVTSDGFALGVLDRLETGALGSINGVFSNGRRLPLAQVAIASFVNPSALDRIGDNMLRASSGSGPAISVDLSNKKDPLSGTAAIIGSGLEQSNVNLGDEFVKLIILQRAYEANSKSLTTTDQMLTLLAQLKR